MSLFRIELLKDGPTQVPRVWATSPGCSNDSFSSTPFRAPSGSRGRHHRAHHPAGTGHRAADEQAVAVRDAARRSRCCCHGRSPRSSQGSSGASSSSPASGSRPRSATGSASPRVRCPGCRNRHTALVLAMHRHGVAVGAPAGPHHPVRAQGDSHPALPGGPDGRRDAVAGLPSDHATQHRAHPADRDDPADHRLAAGVRPALPAHPWWPRLRDDDDHLLHLHRRLRQPQSRLLGDAGPVPHGVIVAASGATLYLRSGGLRRRRQAKDSADEPSRDGCGSTARRGRQSPQEWPEDTRKRRRWTLPPAALRVGSTVAIGALLVWSIGPTLWIVLASLQPESAVTSVPLDLTARLDFSQYVDILTNENGSPRSG